MFICISSKKPKSILHNPFMRYCMFTKRICVRVVSFFVRFVYMGTYECNSTYTDIPYLLSKTSRKDRENDEVYDEPKVSLYPFPHYYIVTELFIV